jgi:hypothetical protein
MGHLDDFELEKAPPPDRLDDDSGSGLWIVFAAAFVVLAAAAGYYLWQREPASEQPAAAGATQSRAAGQEARGVAEPGEDIDVPPLDESDPVVRELVRRLSSHPSVAAWLTTDGLIRNFVVVTANIASGGRPERHLRRLAPQQAFLTRGVEGDQTIDPRSYQRYDAYADAIAAVDARGAARLYATLKPRIDEAYRELGEASGDFDSVLERAMSELLRVPVVQDPVRVTPKPTTYAYEDPRLEALSPPQKQLLRMGPHNVRAVQQKLRDVAGYLGIPPSRLPPPR